MPNYENTYPKSPHGTECPNIKLNARPHRIFLACNVLKDSLKTLKQDRPEPKLKYKRVLIQPIQFSSSETFSSQINAGQIFSLKLDVVEISWQCSWLFEFLNVGLNVQNSKNRTESLCHESQKSSIFCVFEKFKIKRNFYAVQFRCAVISLQTRILCSNLFSELARRHDMWISQKFDEPNMNARQLKYFALKLDGVEVSFNLELFKNTKNRRFLWLMIWWLKQQGAFCYNIWKSELPWNLY